LKNKSKISPRRKNQRDLSMRKLRKRTKRRRVAMEIR